LIFLFAVSLMYLAVSMKILALPINKSPLSMPGPLGLAPTRRAYYESLKPSA
jgi:hypothetical protein